MREIVVSRPQPITAERCALLLRALGDSERLKIIGLLRKRPYAVSDLAESLRDAVANVSHHLGVLRRAGLVVATRDGKRVICRLPDQVPLAEDACPRSSC